MKIIKNLILVLIIDLIVLDLIFIKHIVIFNTIFV